MAETAKKYYFTYDESDEAGAGPQQLLEKILADPEFPEVKDLTIGYWGECFEASPQAIIDGMVEHKDKFAHVEALYIGDMDYEECEVSWIIQGDYSQLFAALPDLKSLTIKGAQDLVLGKQISHDKLEKLEIVCGGLDISVIRDIMGASLPSLKTLILYLGVDSYGFNAGKDDIKALLDNGNFPALTHLGLVDSEEQDQVTALILESRILPQLKTLDLSYGVMTDEGGRTILAHAPQLAGLECLKISYHYMSGQMVKQLQALPLQAEIDDGQATDDEYKYPMVTE